MAYGNCDVKDVRRFVSCMDSAEGKQFLFSVLRNNVRLCVLKMLHLREKDLRPIAREIAYML